MSDYSYTVLASYSSGWVYPGPNPPVVSSLGLVEVVAPSQANGCIGQYRLSYAFIADGVGNGNSPYGFTVSTTLTHSTGNPFYNSNNTAVKIKFQNGDLTLTEPTWTSLQREDRSYTYLSSALIYIYVGTALPEPILPSDVGLSNIDFLNIGATTPKYFCQLQSPNSLNFTITEIGYYSYPTLVYSVNRSRTYTSADLFCTGGGGGGSTVSVPSVACSFGSVVPSEVCAMGSSVPTETKAFGSSVPTETGLVAGTGA